VPLSSAPECRLDRACGHWLPYDPKLHELDGQEDLIRGTKQMSNSWWWCLGTNREQIGNKLPKNTRELGRSTRT
jgi:hypothetical protein